MKKIAFPLICFLCFTSYAQIPSKSSNDNHPPALSAIRQSDLKHDLYYLASDSMHGRRAGTLDELNAAAWIAQEAQKEGLQPAGDNGTYFQYFPLLRTVTSDNSVIKINGNNLNLWKDAWVTEPIETNVNGNVLWLSALADTVKPEINGNIVAINIFPPTPEPPMWVSLWGFRYVYTAIRQQSDALKRHGAKAIILVADSTASVALTSLEHVLDLKKMFLRNTNQDRMLLTGAIFHIPKKSSGILKGITGDICICTMRPPVN